MLERRAFSSRVRFFALRGTRVGTRFAGRFILVLAALLLGRHDDARRQMFKPDGALRLVDVLASGAARTKGINLTFPQQLIIRFRQYNHLAINS